MNQRQYEHILRIDRSVERATHRKACSDYYHQEFHGSFHTEAAKSFLMNGFPNVLGAIGTKIDPINEIISESLGFDPSEGVYGP
jgi:hypothetical protein